MLTPADPALHVDKHVSGAPIGLSFCHERRLTLIALTLRPSMFPVRLRAASGG